MVNFFDVGVGDFVAGGLGGRGTEDFGVGEEEQAETVVLDAVGMKSEV